MQVNPPGQPTHPDNVQGTAPQQSPRPDLLMATAGPPDLSLVTTITIHDRGASAGPSRCEPPLHPRETPMVSETWHPRDSGRETLPRNSVIFADAPDVAGFSRRSSPVLRTSTRHRDADQSTSSRQPSPLHRCASLCQHLRVCPAIVTPDKVRRCAGYRRPLAANVVVPTLSTVRLQAARTDAFRANRHQHQSLRVAAVLHRADRQRLHVTVATVRTPLVVRRHVFVSATVHASHTDRHRSRRATVMTLQLVRRHVVVPTTVNTHTDRRRRTSHLCVHAATPATTPRGASRHRLHAADITVVTAIIRPNPSRRQRHDVPAVATMLVATLLRVSRQRHRLPAVAATPALVRRHLDATHRWPLMEFLITALPFAATDAHRRCSSSPVSRQ